MKLSLQIAVLSAAILGGVLGYPKPDGNPVEVELEVDVKELKEKRTQNGFKEPVKVTKVTFVNLSEDDRKKLSLFGTNVEININKDESKEELIALPNYVTASGSNFHGEHIGGNVILPVLMPFPLGLFFPSPPLNLSLGFSTNKNLSLGVYAGPSGGPNAGGGDVEEGDGWGWDSNTPQGWSTPAPQGWSSTTPGWNSPTQGWPSTTTTTQGWTTPGWGWGSGVRKSPAVGGGGFQMSSKPQNNNNNPFASAVDVPVPSFGKPGPANMGFKPISMSGEGTTIETVAHQSSTSSESSVIDASGNSLSAAENSAPALDIPIPPVNAEAPVVPVEASKISVKSRRHADHVDDEIQHEKKAQEVISESEVAPEEDVSHHEDKKEAHEEEESPVAPEEDSVDLRNAGESQDPAAEVEASNQQQAENQPQSGKGRKPRPHGSRDKPSKSRPTLDSGMKDKNAEHFGLPHQNPAPPAASFQSTQDSSQKDQPGYPNVLGWQLPSFKWSSFSEIFQSFMGSTTTGAMTHIKKSPAPENMNMDMGKSDSPADDEADEAEKCIDDEDLDEVYGIKSPVIHAHTLCSTAANGKANDCNTACVGKGFSGGTCLGPHPTPGCLCKMPNTKDYSMLLTPLNKDQKEIPKKCKKCACADACTKSGSFTGFCMDQCYCAVPWFAKSE